jgi:hypothetical protein
MISESLVLIQILVPLVCVEDNRDEASYDGFWNRQRRGFPEAYLRAME